MPAEKRLEKCLLGEVGTVLVVMQSRAARFGIASFEETMDHLLQTIAECIGEGIGESAAPCRQVGKFILKTPDDRRTDMLWQPASKLAVDRVQQLVTRGGIEVVVALVKRVDQTQLRPRWHIDRSGAIRHRQIPDLLVRHDIRRQGRGSAGALDVQPAGSLGGGDVQLQCRELWMRRDELGLVVGPAEPDLVIEPHEHAYPAGVVADLGKNGPPLFGQKWRIVRDAAEQRSAGGQVQHHHVADSHPPKLVHLGAGAYRGSGSPQVCSRNWRICIGTAILS